MKLNSISLNKELAFNKKKKKISYILHNYLFAEEKINKLFEFTRKYCKKKCHKLPTGCCDYNWYRHRMPEGEIYKVITSLRKKFARRNIKRNKCDYFIFNRGCVLKYLRSPLCIGMICPTLSDHLKEKFGVIYNSTDVTTFFERTLRGKTSQKEIGYFNRRIDNMIHILGEKRSY